MSVDGLTSDYRAPDAGVAPVPRPRAGVRVSALLHRNVTNLPIRVSGIDWAALVTGQKLIFRTYSGMGGQRERPVVPPGTECPRPCLLYTVRGRAKRWEAKPAVLLGHRQEPLGSITPEDLWAEGFEFLPAFRRYWKSRYPTVGWRPWDMVSVLEVRPMCQGDIDSLGVNVLGELVGEWMEGL